MWCMLLAIILGNGLHSSVGITTCGTLGPSIVDVFGARVCQRISSSSKRPNLRARARDTEVNNAQHFRLGVFAWVGACFVVVSSTVPGAALLSIAKVSCSCSCMCVWAQHIIANPSPQTLTRAHTKWCARKEKLCRRGHQHQHARSVCV